MADNSTANAALTAQIAALRALPVRLHAEAVPEVARVLEASLRANIAAARAPDGTSWALTKLGEKPLRNAGKALSVKTLGTVVLARITGPEALHHLGQAAGKIRRQILPTKRIPDDMTRAIRAAIVKVFQKVSGRP